MGYPAQVLIQGNTQEPGGSLAFNNGVAANINGRKRNNKLGIEKQYFAFARMRSKAVT